MSDQTELIRDRLLSLLHQAEADRSSLDASSLPAGLTGVAAYDQLIGVIRQLLEELDPSPPNLP